MGAPPLNYTASGERPWSYWLRRTIQRHMADNQSSQGDKSRKTRPFGSFLLFLTVLVVILIAFGGEHLKPSEKLTWFT